MTDRPKLLAILGAGGHGFVIAEAAELSGRWDTIVFFDDAYPTRVQLGEWAIIGDRRHLLERLAQTESDCWEVVVALGQNDIRTAAMAQLAGHAAKFATIVHPSAHVSRSATVAAGSVVLAGAVINGRARIGTGCIVNLGALVDHDVVVEDGAHLAPGTVVAGHAVIGASAWLQTGCRVAPGAQIAALSVVAAGTTLLS